MRFFKSRKKEQKASPVHNGATVLLNNEFISKPRNMLALQVEGYCRNPTIYRCVTEISKNAARIPLYVRNKKTQEAIKEHPLVSLLNNPNPLQSGKRFIEEIFTDYETIGNAYVVASAEIKPKELWRLDPKKMEVEPGKGGLPKEYIYAKGTSHSKTFIVDGLTGRSLVMHKKTINPINPWYGLPPLEVAAISGDLHNAGLEWNYSLLRNGGRPSGALTTEGTVSEEALNRLKEWKNKILKGSKNAGEIPILTNGLKWTSFSESPKDMDFGTSLTSADKYIAMVYGVPLALVTTEASTYNNIELAQEKLYEDTIVPLMDDFISDLNRWLVPMFGDNIEICYDLDGIPALEKKRQRLFDRVKAGVEIGLISRDEGREMIDFEKRGGAADELLVSSTLMPIDMSLDNITDTQFLKNSLKVAGYSDKEITDIITS